MHIMLDLETMGNTVDAAIVEIGAVAFDTEKIVSRFLTGVSLDSSIRHGLRVTGSTVAWWMGQSESAHQSFLFSQADAMSLPTALHQFQSWLTQWPYSSRLVWGNGAVFDNAILRNAYARLPATVPWAPHNDRCYRTIKNLQRGIELKRVGTFHNARDDAESQALHLIAIWNSNPVLREAA